MEDGYNEPKGTKLLLFSNDQEHEKSRASGYQWH